MSSQLEQLLGYLERDGVTEILFGSGRPIAMRNAKGMTNITARPLSAEQLLTLVRGSEIQQLVPDGDGEGPIAQVTIGKRQANAQVARRGNEIVVKLTRPESAPATLGVATMPLARVATPRAATEPPMRTPALGTPVASEPSAPPSRPSPAVSVKSSPPPTSTGLPRARTTTATRTGSLVPPAASAPTPGPAAFDSFSLEDDGIELGAPVPPATETPPPAPPAAYAGDGISLGALDGTDFQLDLGPGAPPAAGSFDVDFSTSPPQSFAKAGGPPPPAAGFDIDLGTTPPQAFALAQPEQGFAKPRSEPFANARGDTKFAKPRGDEGFAKAYSEPFAKPQAGGATQPIVKPGGMRDTQSIAVGTAATQQFSPGLELDDVGGAALSLGDEPPPVVPGSSQPIARFKAPARPVSTFAAFVHAAREAGASDLHISAARVTSLRVHGELVPIEGNTNPLSAEAAEELLLPLLDPGQRAQLDAVGYVDLAIDAPGGGRLRTNISRQQQGYKGTFRLALATPVSLEELGLPAELAKVVSHHQGLVVIAGPSGHGKTTTLAALVDLLNSSKPYHILSIEDPVEIIHPRKQAVISQREAGRDTVSFARGLKASLREDPDVIVIGELRDRESVEIALTAAETGHLVIATMSTPSAAKTIDRLIDMFPPEDHSQVRASIAGALRAIVAQRLLPKKGGGIVPAIELVTGVLPLAVLIRDDKLYQLPNLMQRGRAFGMIRFDESLAEHVRAGRIDEETALSVAESKKELAATLRPAAAAAAPQTKAIWGFGKKDNNR